jgi:hypothetical protein
MNRNHRFTYPMITIVLAESVMQGQLSAGG